MRTPDQDDVPDDSSAPVRFDLPAALLAQLRARRELQCMQRVSSCLTAELPREPLSIDDIFRLSGTDADESTVAKAYADGMDRCQAQVEEDYDAFLLDPGFGPMVYLTSKGHIVVDNRTWDNGDIVIETSLDHAIRTLVVGAKKTGISDLLQLVPKLPGGEVCPLCDGTRWMSWPKVVCVVCDGRGEVDQRLLSREGSLRFLQHRDILDRMDDQNKNVY